MTDEPINTSGEYLVKRFEELIIKNSELADLLEKKNKDLAALGDKIKELSDAKDSMTQQGYKDPLTGCFNAFYFESVEAKKFDDPKTNPLSVISADINGLKHFNEIYGYEVGTQLIVDAARIFTEACGGVGDSDGAGGGNEAIIRIGGGLFCIILPNTGEDKSKDICKRIREGCKQNRTGNLEGGLFFSIGLGQNTRISSGESLRAVCALAQTRMYRRKLLEPESVYSSIVTSIVSTLEERYDNVHENIIRMKKLCNKIGRVLGLQDHILDELELLCIMHDIGKIAIRETVINKNAKLTKAEKKEIQTHPEIGSKITDETPEFRHISEGVLSHHEKWDGTGYPGKLKGDEIPLTARIMAIVDAYEAMTMGRPYREPFPEEYVISEILTCAGTQFDPMIAKVFIEDVLTQKK